MFIPHSQLLFLPLIDQLHRLIRMLLLIEQSHDIVHIILCIIAAAAVRRLLLRGTHPIPSSHGYAASFTGDRYRIGLVSDMALVQIVVIVLVGGVVVDFGLG